MAQTATTATRQQHYFVPQPMPWPIMGSLALFLMAVGATFVNGKRWMGVYRWVS